MTNIIVYNDILLNTFTGSLNDAGTFQQSDLGILLNKNAVPLPRPNNLPNSNIMCPYFFIGDSGFGLKEYIITPYARCANLTCSQKIFNYRLCRARRLI